MSKQFKTLNRSFLYGLFCSLGLLFTSCLCAVDIYVVNSESRTLSHINTDNQSVQNVFTQLGVIPNKFVLDEHYLYVVNSGDNAVQMIDRTSGSTLRYIPVAASSNPWDAVLDDRFLYVTGLFTNKVYKISLDTYNVVNMMTVGNAPEALCVYNGKLYVTITGGYQNNYAGSGVAVIDLNTWNLVKTIPVAPNPQYIIASDGMLHVSCTGNWVDQLGKICIINPQNDSLIYTLDIGGNVGGLWINSAHIGYVGDAMNNVMYSYSAENYTVLHNSSNPITPGGIAVCGTQDMIILLDSVWGQNGMVRVLHPDLSAWMNFTVGMAPTDIKIYQSNTPVEDNEQSIAVVKISVFPNPVRNGEQVSFTSDEKQSLSVSIFNLKGQLVRTLENKAGSAVWNGKGNNNQYCSSGVYLYRVKSDKAIITGKLLLK